MMRSPKPVPVLTPEASRAARGLLDWSLRELATRAGVSFETVSRFEGGRPARRETLTRVLAALEAEGIEVLSTRSRTGAILVRTRPTE